MYISKDRATGKPTFAVLRMAADTIIFDDQDGVRHELDRDHFLANFEPLTQEIGQQVAYDMALGTVTQDEMQAMFEAALVKARADVQAQMNELARVQAGNETQP